MLLNGGYVMNAIDLREAELYKDALEALGKRAPRKTIQNLINRVAARVDDAELRKMLRLIEDELKAIDPNVVPIKETGCCKALATKIIRHCNQALGRSEE